MCYESIGQQYTSKYTNKQLFEEFQPMSEYVWRARFSLQSGRLCGGVLLHEWLQLLQQSAEQWGSCDTNPDACSGADPRCSVSCPCLCATDVGMRLMPHAEDVERLGMLYGIYRLRCLLLAATFVVLLAQDC